MGKGWLVRQTPLVLTANPDNCSNPIVVVGTHRSGTTLLRRILDSHHAIACPPETNFWVHFTPMLNDPATFTGTAGMGFDETQTLAGFRNSLTYFHDQYRISRGKTRWADKTPDYVFHLDTLERLLPQRTQYLFIFRHPLDVAYSLMQRGWALQAYQGDADRLEVVCEYVARSVAQQLAFLEKSSSSSCALYYDRLVAEPEAELRRVCVFLREEWDPAMLSHHQQHHDHGTEDPVARGTRGFRASHQNWLGWEAEDQDRAWRYLEHAATRLGFERSVAHVVNPVSVPDAVEPGPERASASGPQ